MYSEERAVSKHAALLINSSCLLFVYLPVGFSTYFHCLSLFPLRSDSSLVSLMYATLQEHDYRQTCSDTQMRNSEPRNSIHQTNTDGWMDKADKEQISTHTSICTSSFSTFPSPAHSRTDAHNLFTPFHPKHPKMNSCLQCRQIGTKNTDMGD